jgi:hypothetical protein
MKYSTLWLMILLLNGCDPDSTRSDITSSYGLFITTDKTDYVRNEKTIIKIVNNTDHTAVFEACLSDVFYCRDKWVDYQWVQWTSLSCSDTSMYHLILKPHSMISDSIVVHKPGDYRFRYPMHWEGAQNTPDTLSSNSFTIH